MVDPADGKPLNAGLAQGVVEEGRGLGHGAPPSGDLQTAKQLASGVNKARDRIVILGRRRSGKTIFLARLYDRLWNSAGELHMRALSGDSHTACMEAIEDLRCGRWPASTLGAQYTDIELTYNGGKRLVVALDYPGEVFRRAFVENAETEDARELLDHVDRAAAVIVLLDPGVVDAGSTSEVIDDDYGMVQAIHRIREWPGGREVPIVFVLTKCDIHKKLLRDEGGLAEYLKKHYVNLIRAVERFKVFASAAVQASIGTDGELIPNLTRPPIGVVEPLEYCLDQMAQRETVKLERRAREERLVAYEQTLLDEHRAKRKAIMFWSIFWSVALVLLAAVALISWFLTQGAD